MKTYKIAVLPGDGIGPEVMDVGLAVLGATAKKYGFEIIHEEFAVGGGAPSICSTTPCPPAR